MAGESRPGTNITDHRVMFACIWCVYVPYGCLTNGSKVQRFKGSKVQRLMHIKPGNGKAYTKPNTTIMLLIILGVFKDLQTAVNERVYNIVWVMKRCVGESVMMEIGHIH